MTTLHGGQLPTGLLKPRRSSDNVSGYILLLIVGATSRDPSDHSLDVTNPTLAFSYLPNPISSLSCPHRL